MFLDSIKQKLDNADIISFDIFDTLLLRPYVNPNDLFYHIEKVYNIAGYAKARQKAEQNAWDKYRINKEDITLDEIYLEIEDKYKKYKTIEIEFEITTSISNEEMYDVYKYALDKNKIIIFTSDMYLPKKVILKMLNKNGYTKFNKLYISCEYGKLKKSGNLFKLLQNDMQNVSKNILHIGDNKISDIESSRKLGILSVYYEDVYSRYLKQHKNIVSFIQKYKDVPEISIIVKLAAIKEVIHEKDSYWNNFGYIYEGCSSYAFINWIFEKLPKRNDILFIARDGYTLQKVFTMLYGTLYKTHYVYAPRSLNLLCQLNFERVGRFAFEHTKTIIDYYKGKSDKLSDAPKIKTGEEGCEYIDKHLEIFKELAQQEKNNYIKYLKSKHLKSKNLVLVDTVSMFYSAQKFISSLMPDKIVQGFYYLIQTGAEINKLAYSFKKQSHYSPDLSLIEFMMTSPEPPILNIENGKPVYKDNISKSEKLRQKACVEMSNGTLNFIKDVKDIFGNIKLNISSEMITDWIMLLVNNPTEMDKKEFLLTQCAYDPEHKDYHPVFPQWYNNTLKMRDKHSDCILKTKFAILGIPMYCKYYEQKKSYLFCGIPIITAKEKGSVIRYKLFNIIPIFKIRKIYKY